MNPSQVLGQIILPAEEPTAHVALKGPRSDMLSVNVAH